MVAKRHPRKKPRGKRQAGAPVTGAVERRERFVKEYLIDHNGTQAAIRTGYSPKAAGAQASRLLKDVNVRALIDAADAKAVAKLDVSREAILAELAKIGFSNPLDYGRIVDGHFEFDLTNTTRDQMGAVQELTSRQRYVDEALMDGKKGKKGGVAVLERHTKLKLSNKREALVDLGRAIGLFKDDGGDGQPVTFIIQNLHVGETHGRAQGERGAGEEFVDPARTTAHLR